MSIAPLTVRRSFALAKNQLEQDARVGLAMALSRLPSIGTFWAISLGLPDMQIIDFARVGRPTPVAVDK
jgi:hypothetical protein